MFKTQNCVRIIMTYNANQAMVTVAEVADRMDALLVRYAPNRIKHNFQLSELKKHIT